MPVVPVIIGPPLPASTVDNMENEEYYCYLMLLFHPWRSMQDLKQHEQSWQSAYEAAPFNNHTRSLISNMTVDRECRDAKADHCFPSSEDPLSQFSCSQEDPELEGELLSLLLEEEDTCHQHLQGGDGQAICQGAQAYSRMPEDERELQRIAERMSADAECPAQRMVVEDGCTQITQALEATIEDHKRLM